MVLSPTRLLSGTGYFTLMTISLPICQMGIKWYLTGGVVMETKSNNAAPQHTPLKM